MSEGGWVDGWVDAQTDGQTDGCMYLGGGWFTERIPVRSFLNPRPGAAGHTQSQDFPGTFALSAVSLPSRTCTNQAEPMETRLIY